MDHERGDDYLRRIAAFIRTNEPRLAEAGFQRRRRSRTPAQSASAGLSLNPLQWFSSDTTPQQTAGRPKPLAFAIDTHHLFYALIRLEALGYNVGSLDVKVAKPSRPMNYVDVFRGPDTSDAMSLSSIRTSLSAVSRLSLGVGLWGRPEPPSVDQELKYIFSSFTKIPALSLRSPGPKKIAEIADDPPNENALPLDAFRNLQSLECQDIDPRTLLGWDRLSEALWSLTVRRSGLDDVSDLFIDAVNDDRARRQDTPSPGTNGLSRQSSFHSSRLPESIVEDTEDTATTPTSDTPPRAPSSAGSEPAAESPKLPPSKWAFLRHLSLADNSLTFIPLAPLQHLTTLTHLDLSSNLLVAVPEGLSALYNLVSLNLSDNMIDSVLGIYKRLGQVLALNLSRNRLDSLCGLERLMALERVDVRHNQLEESAEVGRLAALPNIAEVWVEGNPLTELERDARVRCLDLFWREGRAIVLDGAPAGFYEKMALTPPPREQMRSTRPPPAAAHSPPIVPVGVGVGVASSGASSSSSPAFSPAPSSHHPSPRLAPSSAGAGAKQRKKRTKRIVDLDADGGSAESSEHAPAPALPPLPRTRSPLAAPAPLPAEEEDPTPRGSAIAPRPPTKHRRSRTEYAPGPEPEPAAASLPAERTLSVAARRSAARARRAAASVFEAPGAEAEAEAKEGEAFRARIEALRAEMGDGWLKVFSQGQAAAQAGALPSA
ncbi:hypothetical protein BC834DRAFT_1026141 [Gloeopeniophorella convolvens]|nr:hypothetical protein BC834DRAFT_1026141 [Gloeopeniophorella convolvens]